MPTKTPSKFSPSVVLRAACRRDALLRGRRVLPALAAIAALQGCVAVGGTTRSDSPTLGKQLIDLKAAFESGAINETEYQSARQQLLKQS
jgi:hypothetical protein